MNDKKKRGRHDGAWQLISTYSRKQALEDGVLVDVTETAQEAGFKMPVAMTRTSFDLYVTVPEGVTGQDESGRLWDVLRMLHHAIRTSRKSGSEQMFEVLVRNSDDAPAQPVQLRALCGPGDDAEPVLTVMLPTED